MARRLFIITCAVLCWIATSVAQTPSPEAMTAARSLVTTMKLADQFKALLPTILLVLKPALTQDRPAIERDYAATTPMIAEAFTPHYSEMVEGAAGLYARNFTTD